MAAKEGPNDLLCASNRVDCDFFLLVRTLKQTLKNRADCELFISAMSGRPKHPGKGWTDRKGATCRMVAARHACDDVWQIAVQPQLVDQAPRALHEEHGVCTEVAHENGSVLRQNGVSTEAAHKNASVLCQNEEHGVSMEKTHENVSILLA
jgi:hypothetical protein